MIKFFMPKQYVNHFSKIDLDLLQKENKKLFLCDLDNTLVGSYTKDANEEVKAFIKEVQNRGMEFIIVSNNKKDRVETFAKVLDIKYYYMSLKPSSKTFTKIRKKYKVNKKEMIMCGDQLLTDILGSNIYGIDSIFVDPIENRDTLLTRFNRFFEKRIRRHLKMD